MKWLDRISLPVLAIMAVFLAFAPFTPEPHLLEKSRMLLEGTLVKPIDVFDLVLHAAPLLLLILKLLRRKPADSEGH